MTSARSTIRRPLVPRQLTPRSGPRAPHRPGALAPFAVPAFRAYAGGQALSGFGTWIQNITQDWLILSLTHSAQAVGLTAAFQFLPALLLGSYGGTFADRLPRKRLLVAAQSLNCALAATMAALALTGLVRPWHIYLIALTAGLVWVVDNPARKSLLGDLVPRDALRSAVSVNSSIFQSARIVAPALAAAIITTAGSGTAFAVDTGFFAAGLAAWARVPVPARRPGRRPAGSGSLAALRESFGYLRERPRIGVTIALVGIVGTFGLNFPIVLTVMAQQEFHGGADLYGLFNIMIAVGSVAGSLFAAGHAGAGLRRIVLLGAAFGAVQLLTALMHDRLAFLGLLLVLGFSNLTFQAVANSAVQLWTDPGLRGRVLGLYGQVFVGGTPIGAPVIGALTGQYGGRAGMAVCGAVPLLSALALGGLLFARQRLRGAGPDGR